ncbi:hypothetical protein A0H81_10667 [Grifola frondosa]|uniref:Major facilitator superfamily (MFS) profile domain-containing protein n=1 Tax=Grifola frondosa TaxID=5627 RepID=A0A1C7LZ46_GRIFR|nr:hypothetical protein A0H81_10667 [Grifola frondosa]
MLNGLELSALTAALPRITNELQGTTFVWVGSAYALSGTACIPLSGGLAQLFGRRAVFLGALLIMALGSALCGAAQSMNFLIAGRAVQGLGAGAIISIVAIITSDLVPLSDRGFINGLITIGWAVISGAGPLIGGGLAQSGHWRWIFYLNIPFCGVAAVIMLLFLRVRTPPGSVAEKLRRVDWIGNTLVIAATASCVIALTWSGIQHPWNSASVLVPFILGLMGLVGFIAYEATVAKHPLVRIFPLSVSFINRNGLLTVSQVPFILMSTRTSFSGYAQIFIMPIVLLGIILAYLAISAVGMGILITTTFFPVLAPLPISENAAALSYYMFLRNFAQVWGVTIGGAVLQNELRKRMPADFLVQFPEGVAVAYTIIPLIPSLEEPLKSEVRVAFADSLKVVWEVLTGIAGLGLISCIGMKALPLHTDVDRDWALQNGKNDAKERYEPSEK